MTFVDSTRPVDLVLMAGQSNMDGRPVGAMRLPPERRAVENAWIFSDGALAPLVYPDYQPRKYGPEIGLASVWTAKRGPVVILKVAKGGAGLCKEFDPDRPGPKLRQLLRGIRAVRSRAPLRPAAMIWVQGEQDAKMADWADAYRHRFLTLIDRVRQRCDAPDLPVVCARLTDLPARFPEFERINRSFEALAPEGVRVVGTDGLPKKRDRVHYTPAGLYMLGRRLGSHALSAAETRETV